MMGLGLGTLSFLALVLIGCGRNEREQPVQLPAVAPDTVVVSWSVISQTPDRDSLHAVLEGDRTLVVTNRAADGTMMSVSRAVSKEQYAELIGALRALDCCALRSTQQERASPGEAKPALEINLGDVQCEIELWDSEWRRGRARACGLAVARFHGGGFVPDPPVDDARP
jgi:hypothetical protein